MTTIVYHTELRNPKREAMLTSNGKPAKDQYVLTYEDGSTAFESYGTLIAHRPVNYPKQPIRLDRDAWNYSITTARYRNRFLGEATAETRKRIKNGQYELAALNV